MKRHFLGRFHAPLLAAGVLMGAASGVEAVPIGVFEGPADNAVITGLVDVWGWTTDATSEIESVVLVVDGAVDGRELGYGGERRDVAAAYPDIPAALHSGFAAAIHTKHLANGPHTLTVVVRNELGEETRFDKPVVVSNTPDVGVVWDSIDISGAIARIEGDSIFLDGVQLNGRTYQNLELKFDHFTNAFVIVGFADDLDHDGFDDDDVDHDGYDDQGDDDDDDSDDDGADDDGADDDAPDGPDDNP